MEKFHATLNKASKHVMLDPHMKDGFRRTLEVMTASSVPQASYRLPPVFAWSLAAIVIATTGGTVTFASTHALPGDALYSVKVAAIEPAETAFAFTPEAKADVAVTHLTRRFQEAAALSAAGTLDEHDEQLATLAAADVEIVDRDDQPEARAKFEALSATYTPILTVRDSRHGKFAAAVRLGDPYDAVPDDIAAATTREQLSLAEKNRGIASKNAGSAAVSSRLKVSGRLSDAAQKELDKGAFRAALELSGASAKLASEAQIFSTLGTASSTPTSTTSTIQLREDERSGKSEDGKEDSSDDSKRGRTTDPREFLKRLLR